MFTLTGKMHTYFIDAKFLENLRMSNLNLAALRGANKARLPLFKNNLGQPAHTQPDGSDWTPTEWLIALMGEVGETTEVIHSERCNMPGQRDALVGKELADVQIYLDIVAQRALDVQNVRPELTRGRKYTDLVLGEMIIQLGRLCECYKKHIRGDYNNEQYTEFVDRAYVQMQKAMSHFLDSTVLQAGTKKVDRGIDLAEVTIKKFNETSEKIGVDVHLGPGVWTSPDTFDIVGEYGVAAEAAVDAALNLVELPPIRVSREVYNIIQAQAALDGVVIQEYARRALGARSILWSTRPAPEADLGRVPLRMDPEWTASASLYPMHGKWVEVRWERYLTTIGVLQLTENGFWIDAAHRVYEQPDTWRYMPVPTKA